MQVIITAIGPDNRGLADPIVHFVTRHGANIAEIQMYDRDAARVFAMLLRMDWDPSTAPIAKLREEMRAIGSERGLAVRTWARDEHARPPRVALCTTYRREPARAVLEAIRSGHLHATPAVMLGNRDAGRELAEQFEVDWHPIGDDRGRPDDTELLQRIDEYDVDYIVLARYMRLIPPELCWAFAGGRILNLHHGLLPSFPGARPYHDAHQHNMLTYGATVHFIVPELDAGNQIVHQDTFSVRPGTPIDEVLRIGQGENEPRCLVEGLRRVVDREVELHFHRVVRSRRSS